MYVRSLSSTRRPLSFQFSFFFCLSNSDFSFFFFRDEIIPREEGSRAFLEILPVILSTLAGSNFLLERIAKLCHFETLVGEYEGKRV